jgi:hypothetical protein
MLLEAAPGSTTPVSAREPHAHRYEILLTKLVRERLYDAGCFLLSNADGGRKGAYREPSVELSFQNFIASLLGHVLGAKKA